MTPSNPASTFLNEAEGLLEQIEETALSIQPGDAVGEEINRLFRAFHTIKGSGAMFGFDAVATFTHHVETVLDKVRDGIVPVSDNLLNLILASKDQIKALLEEVQDGAAVPAGSGEKIIAALNALLPARSTPGDAPTAPDPGESQGAMTAASNPGTPLERFHIRFRPHPGLMASGTNPAMLLNELRGLGACEIRADASSIPALELLQADQCCLAWDIDHRSRDRVNGETRRKAAARRDTTGGRAHWLKCGHHDPG